jgi:signal peptidase I
VAGPGDSVYIKEGDVYRQSAGTHGYVKASEPFIKPCSPEVVIVCNLTTPMTVPQGQWFLMGDNRGESDDSRFWGPVRTAWIVGVVTGAE